jgi:hypothetical protein
MNPLRYESLFTAGGGVIMLCDEVVVPLLAPTLPADSAGPDLAVLAIETGPWTPTVDKAVEESPGSVYGMLIRECVDSVVYTGL